MSDTDNQLTDVTAPGVSVVMSVFNQADLVQATIDSVLQQAGIDLELIVVDDGADAAVKKVLASFAGRSNVVIVEQPNQGLTRALINGCAQASKPYIARIDSGDVVLPGRLAAQAAALQARPELVLVSSWVRVVTSEGYHLYDVQHAAEDLREGLQANLAEEVATPFHASLMIRRSSYEEVGGYRKQFYFAQDYDLCSRLIALGDIEVLPVTYTQGLFSASGISGRYADEQQALKQIIVQLGKARRAGEPETDLLFQAACIKKSSDNAVMDDFSGNYFIGKCLLDNGSEHAGKYLRLALRSAPWSLKTWFHLLRWRMGT